MILSNNDTTNGQHKPMPNGDLNEGAIADALQEDATVGYRPVMPLESLWASGGDMPLITMRRDIEFMRMHPVVMAAMEYYKSGIRGAEFWGGPDHNNPQNDKGKPISPDPRVAEFVLAHCERFWQRAVPLLQEGYGYGWSPGEHMYKESQGMLVWSHIKEFHPYDGYILTGAISTPLAYQPLGLRVKNIRGREPVDLWFASEAIPAKACWYAHRPRFNQFYGQSQYLGAWRPWRRLGWRDSVEQVIDAALYRAGYCGPIVRFPPGSSAPINKQGIPATAVDGGGLNRRENRDVARQLVEWAKTGAGFTISSEQYAPAQGGGPKWDITWPEHVMDVSPLINAAEYLGDQIMLGMGVPPELIKAGGTGSGYSGRSIPREAFLDQQQGVADAMLQTFIEQVVKPLVLWNFGDIPFEVSVKPLLKSQVENKQGEPEPPLPQPGEDQQQGQPPDGGQSPPTPAAMSLSDTALEIVRKIVRNGIPLSTDVEGELEWDCV